MKLNRKQIRKLILEEIDASTLITEVRIADSGFNIGDRVKYEGHGAVGDGVIVDIKQDGVNYHGGRDTSPTANPRTILVIAWKDDREDTGFKIRSVPSQHIMHFDKVSPRQFS